MTEPTTEPTNEPTEETPAPKKRTRTRTPRVEHPTLDGSTTAEELEAIARIGNRLNAGALVETKSKKVDLVDAIGRIEVEVVVGFRGVEVGRYRKVDGTEPAQYRFHPSQSTPF